MPVRPGVAVDRGAHPTGNAGQRFQPLESAMVGEIHQILQHRAGPGRDARAIGAQRGLGEAQHQAAEALVGNDQVGAAAGDQTGVPLSRAAAMAAMNACSSRVSANRSAGPPMPNRV